MTIHTATVVPAAVKRPRYESHHAGADPRAEREARERYQDRAHWELTIRNEQLMLDYLAGAPSQRTTALGASIDRNAIMGGTSRMCERCSGGGVLEPKRPTHGSLQMLELIDVELPAEPACSPDELIGAPRRKRQENHDRHLDDPHSDYVLVKALASDRGCSMADVLRTFSPWCPDCQGNGHIARGKPPGKAIDARPTGSSKAPWREHDDRVSEMVRFGRASMVMRRVVEVDPMFELVLVAYFGSTGARWAGSVFGKVFSVYPFTQAGQKLLERTKNQAGEQDPWQRIWGLATDTSKKRDVALLTEAASTQGVALLTRAGLAWNVAAAPTKAAA